ncbi:hypothetical protein R3W88_032256 [Solanum pinnatisectum]|uniref:MADS-box domain-containing protein n=1 Tax=Solanum pinnatisectum TaxID=50273 RepID=A0AAV9LS36_9SOLN|nr:hypothetical protein R3W88_032256 [Solanum pinnatisectum]
MTKKRVRSTRNLDPIMKKVTLDQRLEALRKQANELSILCNIELGMIVFTPGENNAFVWPSLIEAKDSVKKYLASFNKGNLEKLERHDHHLKKIKMVEQKENGETLFNQLVKAERRVDELDITETKSLLKLFAVKRSKLDERKKTTKCKC